MFTPRTQSLSTCLILLLVRLKAAAGSLQVGRTAHSLQQDPVTGAEGQVGALKIYPIFKDAFWQANARSAAALHWKGQVRA